MKSSRSLPRLEAWILDRVVSKTWRNSIQGDLAEECGRHSRAWLFIQTLLVAASFLGPRRSPDEVPALPGGGARAGQGFWADLRYAARRLRGAPGFALTAVAVLGLGIGANSAVFSLVDGMLLEPLPYPRTERLVRVYTNEESSRVTGLASYLDYRDYVEQSGVFEESALTNDGAILSFAGEQGAESVLAEYFSSEFFPLVGLQPFMGRNFLPEEDSRASGQGAVMVSYPSWQRRFGGDPDILGRRIFLNGHPVVIVGVGPREYKGQFSIFPSEFWAPLGTAQLLDDSHREAPTDRGARLFFIYGRLREGVSLDQARAALSTVAGALAIEYPDTNAERSTTAVRATDVRIDPDIDMAMIPVAAFLSAVVLIVLAVACSNLAGLQLLRTATRQHEVALRQALGAGRARIIRLLLLESALLGTLGGGVGLALAAMAASLAPYMPTPLPFAISLSMSLDWTVLGYTLLLSIVTGLLFGLLPAWRISRTDLVGSMKGPGSGLQQIGGRFSVRGLLIATQVALSLVLLVSAGLFLRSLANRHELDPGFNTASTALVVVDPQLGGYRDESRIRDVLEMIQRRAERLPDVVSVATTSRVPMGFWGTDQASVRKSDDKFSRLSEWPRAHLSIVSDGYFETLGIPVVEGREFRSADGPGASRVAVINEEFARRFWGHTAVVGLPVVMADPAGDVVMEVVGVVADTCVRSLREEPSAQLYVAEKQRFVPRQAILMRGRAPGGLAAALTLEIAAIDPSIPVLEKGTMTEHMGMQFFVPRMLAWLLSGFGTLTLVLAAIGLYGSVAFSVAGRTREVGVRIALGARPIQILWMLFRGAMTMVTAGGVVGLVLAWLVAQPLSSQLVGVTPFDPVTFGGAMVLLVVVAAGATLGPARRAIGVDPLEALKAE